MTTPKPPGMRRDPREKKLSHDRVDLVNVLAGFQEGRGLTDAEMLHMVVSWQESLLRDVLKADADDTWDQLRAWALREKQLNEFSAVPNQAQLQIIDALLHRMERAEQGDPSAFETI